MRNKGRYEEAVQNFRRALGQETDDLNAQTQYEIGECLENSGKLNEALDEYGKVLRLYPKSKFWRTRAELVSAKILERLVESIKNRGGN